MGQSNLTSGGYNFRRAGWQYLNSDENIHNCSLSVVKNSKVEPFKYVCKYFGIKPNEENLEFIEEALNSILAIDQGRSSLNKERGDIIDSISEDVPIEIEKYAINRLCDELGLDELAVKQLPYPTYIFQYVSAGGNSTARNEIVFDIFNLESFVSYLDGQIKWRKSISGQRALMTSALREKIKKRDGYKCKKCGASMKKEPNLLLEIDHIIPVSHGGITSEDNLRTLCWRCNRKKGNKIE